MASKSFKIDPSRFSLPRETEIDGSRVTVWESPDNIPQEVSLRFDEEKKRFILEFNYSGGEEPLVEVDAEGRPIEVSVGKQSGRVCRIELDPSLLNCPVDVPEQLKSSVEETHKKLSQRANRFSLFSFSRQPRRLPQNYKPVEQIITDYGPRLFGSSERELSF
jgi:hypothetical protein